MGGWLMKGVKSASERLHIGATPIVMSWTDSGLLFSLDFIWQAFSILMSNYAPPSGLIHRWYFLDTNKHSSLPMTTVTFAAGRPFLESEDSISSGILSTRHP